MVGIIVLQEGIRFIPIVSAQQLTKTIALPKDSMFIPFKMNTAGVLPVVIASSVLVVGSTILSFQPLQGISTLFTNLPSIGVKIFSSFCFFY